ncbi:MAG TPA: tetratricopeptide repeat protein [Prosthecobacter sp.]
MMEKESTQNEVAAGASRSPQTGVLAHETPPGWRQVLLTVVVVAAFVVGSGYSVLSMGLVTLLMGVAVFLAPPQFRLPWWPALALLAVAVMPGLGQLPAAWFGGTEPWRQTLWEAWGIALPGTVSADPLASMESWLQIAAGAVWLWTCLGQGTGSSGRRWSLGVLAGGGALVAALSLAERGGLVSFPWWPRETGPVQDYFGPFANRNHMASLNAIGALLCAAMAYDGFRRQSRVAWVFVALFWLPLVAIFVNTSRGGLLLLALGLGVWATASAMRGNVLRRLAVFCGLALVVGSVAVVSSGGLGGRLRSLIETDRGGVVTSTLRSDLARETLASVAGKPWAGHGFDTFALVFPLETGLPVWDVRFMHPESDLLLLLFEGGVLFVLPVLALLFWTALASGPWKRSRKGKPESGERLGRRLRQAAAVGALMALLHSVFDVPNRGLAYGLHTAVLLGLAVRGRSLGAAASSLEKGIFRLLGLGIAGLGVMWLGVSEKAWVPDLASSVTLLREEAVEKGQEGDFREALRRVDHALWLAPLNYRLYYHRAQLLLYLRQRPERALQDFGRARALEPHYAGLCLEEGRQWLAFAPELAIIPWREALNRLPPHAARTIEAYGGMLADTYPHRELRPALWTLAETPDMQILFLRNCLAGEEWQHYLELFLKANPALERLAPDQLKAFFKVWYDLGDRKALCALLGREPKLEPYGWRALAADLADQGRHDEAVRLAAKYLKRQPRVSASVAADIPRLERAFVFNANDPRAGVELFVAQRGLQQLKEAKSTALKVLALPSAPVYMRLELALLLADMQDYREAWEVLAPGLETLPER